MISKGHWMEVGYQQTRRNGVHLWSLLEGHQNTSLHLLRVDVIVNGQTLMTRKRSWLGWGPLSWPEVGSQWRSNSTSLLLQLAASTVDGQPASQFKSGLWLQL